MSILIVDCPRCGANQITFDTNSAAEIGKQGADWQRRFEVFSVCRRCRRTTVFVVRLKSYNVRELLNQPKFWTSDSTLNELFDIQEFISLKDVAVQVPPDHVPDEIATVFREGATCLSVECFNAASTMFRLCLDLATRPLLPAEGAEGAVQPNRRQRRDLGLRIPWLIERGLLPAGLAELAAVVREDGNDGAHVGNLGRPEAEDLLDFTQLLLERLFTEPARLRIAEARRRQRRGE